ncbi:MAG: hypothetical protein R6X33_18335 [Candidatus Brocadiia bacterium]
MYGRARRLLALRMVVGAVLALVSCDLPEPVILFGRDYLAKQTFYHKGGMPVVHLEEIPARSEEAGRRVAVFDQQNMHVVTYPEGELVRTARLGWPRPVYEPFLWPADSGEGFWILSSGVYSGTGLLDDRGNKVWEFGGGRDMEAADLDGDGRTEFYVASLSGLYCVAPDRSRLWRAEGSYWSLAVVPESPSGPVVAALGSDGRTVTVFSSAGQPRWRFQFSTGPELESCAWPSQSILLAARGRSIHVLDLHGDLLRRIRLTWRIGGLNGFAAIPVRFAADEPRDLAMLGHAGWSSNRSVLCVVNEAGTVLYEETLESTTGMCVIAEDERQALLVGDGTGRVNKYTLKP